MAKEIVRGLAHVTGWTINDVTGRLHVRVSYLTNGDISYLAAINDSATVHPYDTHHLSVHIPLKSTRLDTLAGQATNPRSITNAPPTENILEADMLTVQDIALLSSYGAVEVWPDNPHYYTVRM